MRHDGTFLLDEHNICAMKNGGASPEGAISDFDSLVDATAPALAEFLDATLFPDFEPTSSIDYYNMRELSSRRFDATTDGERGADDAVPPGWRELLEDAAGVGALLDIETIRGLIGRPVEEVQSAMRAAARDAFDAGNVEVAQMILEAMAGYPETGIPGFVFTDDPDEIDQGDIAIDLRNHLPAPTRFFGLSPHLIVVRISFHS